MATTVATLPLLLLTLILLGGGGGRAMPIREPFACVDNNSMPFCDTKLPIKHRVNDLLNRLTLQEKIGLLVSSAGSVPRLGIRSYEWWSEALHGVSNVGPGTKFGGAFPGATSFPQVITTASSFNTTLWEAIGRVVSDEGRAMYNGGAAGLTFWSPNVNIFRDPRWGRGQETPGEDPIVAAEYAIRYVRGLQGDDAERLKVAACCKHYTAYDLDNWNGIDRFHFDAKVSKQDLEDTFDVPFRACVEQGKEITRGEWAARQRLLEAVVAVLSGGDHSSTVAERREDEAAGSDQEQAARWLSYQEQAELSKPLNKQNWSVEDDQMNRPEEKEDAGGGIISSVNGIPTCADPNLLRGMIRRAWGLDGYIVSDCDSVRVFYENQHYTSTAEEAAADAIKAGLDLDCGPFLGTHTEQAITRGLVKESHVDNALINTLTVQMRLGMFDGEPSAQPYGNLGPMDVCTPPHQELALEAARQGIVLLKNQGPVLPLSPRRHKTVAVVGPNSDVKQTMIGNYAGVACAYITPLQGLERYTKAVHQQGCIDVHCMDVGLFDEAVDAAREADATVLVMGLDQTIEAEFRDRDGLLLPGHQQELISRVASASRGPTILVLMSGGPIDITFAKNDPKIAGIVWAGYPGQSGGSAIADVLFGTHNPEGKLPMTWYPQEYLKNLPMTTMSMRPSHSTGYPGRTYRFYKGPVVYPFGHGMSYSKFVHTLVDAPTLIPIPLTGNNAHNASQAGRAIKVTHAKCDKISLTLIVDIRNDGSKDGSDTLLVFSNPPAGHWAPHKQLVAFHKVRIPAKMQERVWINIHVCKFLSVVDRVGTRRIPLGQHVLHIGEVRHIVSVQPATTQTQNVTKSETQWRD
ncbi:unnamed protein product [Rhodiola kirilowii]